MGTGAGERSPVGRLRSSGDLDAMRLLVDLYHAQNLSADGGISREVLRRHYKRKQYGERGNHLVWGFTDDGGSAYPQPSTEYFWEQQKAKKLEKTTIWCAMETLQGTGLITTVPHLMENSKPDCEPMHPFGWNGYGEPIEREIGDAADAAGRYIIGEQRTHTAESDGVDMLAPVWRTQADVQMVGVYRLRYRPQTRLTADWYQRVNEQAKEWISDYQKLNPWASKTERVS